MFDWNELLVIGAAALIFIGPKELPGTLRTLGKFVAKARGMARDFQTNVDDMVREAELDEVKKQVQKLDHGGFERMVQETVDPKGRIQDALRPPDLSAPNPTAASAPASPMSTGVQAIPESRTSPSATIANGTGTVASPESVPAKPAAPAV
jgi:sec-independent protein translocase protein TatB